MSWPCGLPRLASPRWTPLILTFLLPLSFVLFAAWNAYSAQVTLTWDPNTEPDLAGYKVYYGTSSRNYEVALDAGNWTSCVIGGLDEGKTYYFAATAYDSFANESDFSQEVSFYMTNPGADTDGDEIADEDETGLYGTDPNIFDTDGDGMGDGVELAFWGDNWDADYDGDGLINLLDPDADDDGFSDTFETHHGFDPADPDSRPQRPPLEVGEVCLDHIWKSRVTCCLPTQI